MDLQRARKEIDKIDNSILDLLKQRLNIVKEIGLLKKKEGTAVLDPEREVKLLSKLEKKADENKLDPQLVKGIWDLILRNSRSSQEKIKEE